jgi:hypothetical protein
MPEDRPSPIDELAIDRLVDGELDDAERRELLLRLENDPEGWRRCALAFLEDQAWRKALAGVASPGSRPEPVEVTPTLPMVVRGRARRLAIAASVIAATFAAGFAAGGSWRPPGRVEVAQNPPAGTIKPASAGQDRPIKQVGWLNLEDGSAGESPTRRVPILSGPGLDDRWLRQQPPAVSDYDRAQWERRGYQVDERRRLVSVDLEDGRRVSIPVDEVQVEYVGQQPL